MLELKKYIERAYALGGKSQSKTKSNHQDEYTNEAEDPLEETALSPKRQKLLIFLLQMSENLIMLIYPYIV